MAEKKETLAIDPTPSFETASPAHEDQSAHPNQSDNVVTNYLQGWSLHVVTIAYATLGNGRKRWLNYTRLCLAHFLASLEVSIVATSLVAITDDLQNFGESSWIVTAYMLTYTGTVILSAARVVNHLFCRVPNYLGKIE